MSAAPVETPTTPVTPAAPAAPAADASGFPALKGVPTTPAAPAAAAPDAPPALPEWTKGLSSDHLTLLQNKGWDKGDKGIGDVLTAYSNLERLRGVGADKLVKVPDWSNAEEVAAFRTKLGVPAEPTGYQSEAVPLPPGLVDTDAVAKISHALGHTQPQHEAFLGEVAGFFQSAVQAQAEDVARRNAAELVDLKKEWGTKFDEHNQASNNAIAQVGVTDDELDALKISLGEAGARRFLARVGTLLGEHKRPAENSGGLSLVTAASAQAELQALKSDRDFLAKLGAGDREALRKLGELQHIAFGS